VAGFNSFDFDFPRKADRLPHPSFKGRAIVSLLSHLHRGSIDSLHLHARPCADAAFQISLGPTTTTTTTAVISAPLALPPPSSPVALRALNDPRFRRRLNDLSATLESANESAQSGVYIFTQRYIRPCFGSIGSCLTTCVEAGCPHLQQRDRLRRGRRGRAELSFDFYDDWDEDENEGLLGWGMGLLWGMCRSSSLGGREA
jgi:hypothetical protein